MAAMGAVALASVISSGAAAGASVYQASKSGKAPDIKPPPQPAQTPAYDVFSRKNKTGPGAYGIPAPGALADATTASTKLGQ